MGRSVLSPTRLSVEKINSLRACLQSRSSSFSLSSVPSMQSQTRWVSLRKNLNPNQNLNLERSVTTVNPGLNIQKQVMMMALLSTNYQTISIQTWLLRKVTVMDQIPNRNVLLNFSTRPRQRLVNRLRTTELQTTFNDEGCRSKV